MQGLGFGVQGLRLRVWGLRIGLEDRGLVIQGSGFRVQGSGLRARVEGAELDPIIVLILRQLQTLKPPRRVVKHLFSGWGLKFRG